MAEISRLEKLASAKKKLKQFQQKQRDAHSESGRSTPSKKKSDEEGFEKALHSENGGSTFSLSHCENVSTNISETESPIPTTENGTDNLCNIFNGQSQPDILSTTSTLSNLPTVTETLFQNSSPHSLFTASPTPINSQSGSDFFDHLTSTNEMSDPVQDLSYVPKSVMNTAMFHAPQINASTPDGPQFQHTPNYSFPDASFSPINDARQNATSEAPIQEWENKLKCSIARNEELEKELSFQKNQNVKLQNMLEESKKAVESSTTIRDHAQAIEILVSEKTELQNTLAKMQDDFKSKTGETEELQGRLRASRHRVSDLERELALTKTSLQNQEISLKEMNSRQAITDNQMGTQGQRVRDLELVVSDLNSKLDSRDKSLKSLKEELEEKISKLSLAEIRIQQLSGNPETEKDMEVLRCKNEELMKTICNLETDLSSTRSSNEESVKEYQRYVTGLYTELQELKTKHRICEERCQQFADREHQLVQQVNGLEKQISRVPAQTPDVHSELQALRQQLQLAEENCTNLQAQLQEKDGEMGCLREGLQERALRIQDLELTVTRLQSEMPDTANLQAAIESDKVAASIAVAQNASLKQQLEGLQDTIEKLNNHQDELTRRLQREQQTNLSLQAKLSTFQTKESIKFEEIEQQTEILSMQESETQTLNSRPEVSPEITTKLEEKVLKTMGEIAELKEEKQRLEHLVLQLQGETETIGEYITLYQIQRGMLKQRVQEKDEQVEQLARDKEALRDKLSHLNCLVQRLVGQRLPEVVEKEVAKEIQSVPGNNETADQIKSLLVEIGSNNLVTTNLESPNINFHPCPLCSGRLITV